MAHQSHFLYQCRLIQKLHCNAHFGVEQFKGGNLKDDSSNLVDGSRERESFDPRPLFTMTEKVLQLHWVGLGGKEEEDGALP